MTESVRIEGKYSEAIIYTSKLEEKAASQIKAFLDQQCSEGAKVRIMPDVHAGAGCVIGFTSNLTDKVVPNIVGVDIGCGMLSVDLGKDNFSLDKLDKLIYKSIPVGKNVHSSPAIDFEPLEELLCRSQLKDMRRIKCSIGSLGGGNHFIEVAADENGVKHLVIHSGSRNLGKQVAEIYQNRAMELCSIEDDSELGGKKKKRKLTTKYPRDLCFLTGKDRDNYLHDMKICQEYASLNRKLMANIIVKGLFGKSGLVDFEYFETVHNYVNFDDQIVRKGSISAHAGEKVLIPMNMRDGSLICVGKGNPDWNFSAPHGAGRIMSRRDAMSKVNLDAYKKSMQGIYSTTINKKTLDEAPFAYKSMKEIIDNIQDTVEIKLILKPIYNFKAEE